MTKTRIEHATCRAEFDISQEGSVLRDTARSVVSGFRTHLTVSSDEPPERIERVLRLAKQMCFAEYLVVHPVPLTSTFTVNGEAFELPTD
jgi:hypothetical protein